MNTINVPVPINDDGFFEGTENFFAFLTAGDGFPNNIMLEPVSASANINDDDGKYIQL